MAKRARPSFAALDSALEGLESDLTAEVKSAPACRLLVGVRKLPTTCEAAAMTIVCEREGIGGWVMVNYLRREDGNVDTATTDFHCERRACAVARLWLRQAWGDVQERGLTLIDPAIPPELRKAVEAGRVVKSYRPIYS